MNRFLSTIVQETGIMGSGDGKVGDTACRRMSVLHPSETGSVVLAVSDFNIAALSEQLCAHGIAFANFLEIYRPFCLMETSFPELSVFKQKHSGEKCFCIGNGPSLRISDLEKIQQKGYYTFACNFINKLFDKTEWRPNYYCNTEKSAILTNLDFILNEPLEAKFVGADMYEIISSLENHKVEKEIYFFERTYFCQNPEFSEDIAKIVFQGASVMYSMLQIAAYMGFNEIYLVGVENTMPPSVKASNFSEAKAHFYSEDSSELEKRRNIMTAIGFDDDYQYHLPDNQ
jgi:hypothetical protein